MKFMESDMAAYAESMPLATVPGSAWNYHDGNTIILAHLIRNAAGGRAGDVLQFARTELFAPLGMRHVTLEFDASGNPEGSSQMLATARDWARFGMLYLNDGVVGGQAHPAGRMGDLFGIADAECLGGTGRGLLDQSRRQFWRQLPDRAWLAARRLLRQGHDRQYVIIIPGESLVIVRLGVRRTGRRRPMACSVWSSDVVAATAGKAKLAGD